MLKIHDNPYVAKKVVQELVQKHHVSMIIGGLSEKFSKLKNTRS